MNPNPPPPPPPPMPPPGTAGAQPPTNGMAIAALVTSILGVCVPCLGPLAAIVLAVIAMMKIKGTNQRGMPFAIVALAIAAFISISHIGVVAAIAIPNFIKFQAKAKQAECKTNLKALHTAQMSYFAENDRFSEDVAQLGFAPSKPQRYSYFLSAGEQGWVLGEGGAPQAPDLELAELGVLGECPECSYTAMCSGNIDSDADVDVWVISSEDMQNGAGELLEPGEPHNISPDVENMSSSRGGGSDWD